MAVTCIYWILRWLKKNSFGEKKQSSVILQLYKVFLLTDDLCGNGSMEEDAKETPNLSNDSSIPGSNVIDTNSPTYRYMFKTNCYTTKSWLTAMLC